MALRIYLAGDNHSDWRAILRDRATKLGLALMVFCPQEVEPWKEESGLASAGRLQGFMLTVNEALEDSADLVVLRLSEQYRHWHAVSEAGRLIAKGKPLILYHPSSLDKELASLDRVALHVAHDMDQMMFILQSLAESQMAS